MGEILAMELLVAVGELAIGEGLAMGGLAVGESLTCQQPSWLA
jgi:hypothetical protein